MSKGSVNLECRRSAAPPWDTPSLRRAANRWCAAASHSTGLLLRVLRQRTPTRHLRRPQPPRSPALGPHQPHDDRHDVGRRALPRSPSMARPRPTSSRPRTRTWQAPHAHAQTAHHSSDLDSQPNSLPASSPGVCVTTFSTTSRRPADAGRARWRPEAAARSCLRPAPRRPRTAQRRPRTAQRAAPCSRHMSMTRRSGAPEPPRTGTPARAGQEHDADDRVPPGTEHREVRDAAPDRVAVCGPVPLSPSGRPGLRGGVCGSKIKTSERG